MRNLRIVRKFTSASPLPLPSSSLFCAGENGCLFGCVKIENELTTVDDASLNSSEAETNLPPPHQFLSNLIRISEFNHIEELTNSNLLQDTFAMQYVPSTECLFMANTNGTLLQYQLNGEVEEVLTIEVGITSFNISPDARLALIITKTGSLLLTRLLELESIAQFQMVNESAAEEANITTSWRQDCKYFAVNVPDEKTRRRLKVFDENGALISTTEDSTILISPIIDWQPKGSLLVGLEKSPPGRNTDAIVSFFELNGLKRSEFDCSEGRSTLNQDKILLLVWNNSSDLLAMRKRHSIELWYRSNYVWMCKSSIFSRRKGDDGKGALDGIKFFTWDKQFAYKLHVVFESGFYSAYDFAFGYSCGETNGSRITASLNGSVVYYTPFRDNYAPPPYGFSQISLPSLVKEVVLSKFYDGFICVLASGNIALVQNQGPNAAGCKMFNCEPEHKIIRSYGWIWPNASTLCGIKDNSLLIWKLPRDAMNLDSKLDTLITLHSSHQFNCTSVWPVYWKDGAEATHLVIQKACGYLLLMDLQNLETKKLLRIPSNMFHTFKFMPTSEDHDVGIISNLLIIGHDHLTRKLEVYLSPKYSYKISSDCTSFEVYDDYLLFTTIQGSLEIVHISSLSDVLQSSTAQSQSSNFEKYSRKIEKGSLIISCGLNLMLEPSLILQILPRGNLETISPRPLVLSSLNTLLRDESKRSFEVIMSAMRRHRINSNILVEELKLVESEGIHNVTLRQLLENIVEQVNDSNLLVLFVTELTQENITCIELVRDILEAHITASGDKGNKGILPYLAAMAKLGRYEQVLHSNLILGEGDRELVKSRIKFLSFYSENSEILYEAALGTYDLSLASVVCDCLNKDPKEYLPILNELQDLSLKKRQFSIDNTLKRYSKAVTHLISDTTVKHEEIVKYVEKHKVFTEALQILEDTVALNASCRTEEDVKQLKSMLLVSFGHYLEIDGKTKEASILYTRGGNFAKAVDCCLKTGCWESALGIAFEQKMTDTELRKLYEDMVNALENRKEFEKAAHISQLYLKNTPAAIEFYIHAKKWLHARALATQSAEYSNLVETSIRPKLIDSCESLEEALRTKQTELQNYMNRLRTIRALKAAREAGEMDGENENFSDTESVATPSTRSSSFSSTGSSGTGKTHRSSKNRRKAERKLYSLKEGSRYEDVAITIYLWDLANHVQNEMKSEVAYTIESLWRFQLTENANSLTAQFDNFLHVVNAAVVEVWAGNVLPETPLLESKYRISPIGFNTAWDKLSFSIGVSKVV